MTTVKMEGSLQTVKSVSLGRDLGYTKYPTASRRCLCTEFTGLSGESTPGSGARLPQKVQGTRRFIGNFTMPYPDTTPSLLQSVLKTLPRYSYKSKGLEGSSQSGP